MHHKMLHRALLREEARPVVLGEAQYAGAQKVKLEKCFGKRSQPGPKGRMPIKGPVPAPGRVVPDYGPVGSRRPPPSDFISIEGSSARLGYSRNRPIQCVAVLVHRN
jgi:hypothetical protein